MTPVYDPRHEVVRYCQHVASTRARKLEPWWRWTVAIALAITVHRIDAT